MIKLTNAALQAIRSAIEAGWSTLTDEKERVNLLFQLRLWLHQKISPFNQPIDCVRWVPIEKVHANDYNPNSVAMNEMRLLYTSIQHDGYTQPVVTVYDAEQDLYIIVDGFHRYTIMRQFPDIAARSNGYLPIVVLEKDINDRMASTVRHNRARGKHSVAGMASMVFGMLNNGWTDEAICAEIGVETEELLRLKHVTGFSKLFENVEYQRAWETRRQIQLRKEYRDGQVAVGGSSQGPEVDGDKTVLAKPTENRRSRRRPQAEH